MSKEGQEIAGIVAYNFYSILKEVKRTHKRIEVPCRHCGGKGKVEGWVPRHRPKKKASS